MHKRKLFGLLMFCVIGLFAACVPYSNAQAQQKTLGIAAVVNDDVISVLDLRMRTEMIIATSNIEDTPENRARISPQILRGLIDEKLMLQESRRVGITIPQSDIDDGLKSIADNNNITLLQLSEQLKKFGVPLTALGTRIEAELSWQKMVARSMASSIKISKEEIDDEIKRIQASAGKPEYLLAEIYLPVDKPGQDAEVHQVAERLLEQLLSGAPFNALATNFSRAPSAAQNGDMGWVQASNLDPALLSVVRNMKPKTASKPIRALGGYYILMLRDTRTSPGLGGGEATMKLAQVHLSSKNGNNAQLSARLRNITQGVTNCDQFNAIGAKMGSPMSGSLGEVKLSSLPKTMSDVLQSLPVGQVSPPVETGGGMAVMMVCERQDQGVDMKKVRDDIAERLTIERLDVAASRKLRDLRREAFVDIRL